METEAAPANTPAPRRRGPASTENGQRSRDRALRAALDVIAEAGIDQVRVAEIARRAGMSSGQLMYYFTSKEHILLETLAWTMTSPSASLPCSTGSRSCACGKCISRRASA